jgi:hypothetical protein
MRGRLQVGVAAIEHGCHLVGIDASEDYITEICIPRLVQRVRAGGCLTLRESTLSELAIR